MNVAGLEQVFHLIIAALLAMTRTLAALSVFPLFVREYLPPATRAAVALAYSLLVAPALWPEAATLAGNVTTIALILKEAMLGIALGFTFGLLFWAMENVGHLIDFQTGFTFSQIIDPLVGNQSSVHARLLLRVFALYFLLIGGLRLFLEALYASYAAWPVLAPLPELKPGWLHIFSDQLGLLFTLTLLFAAPTLLVLLLVELAFGLFNRAAPSFNVTDATRPIKAWIATGIVLITLPFMLERSVQVITEYRGIIDLLKRAA